MPEVSSIENRTRNAMLQGPIPAGYEILETLGQGLGVKGS